MTFVLFYGINLFLAWLLAAHSVGASLPSLPQRLNVESSLILLEPGHGKTEIFSIEEFVDQQDGSLRVNVLSVPLSDTGTEKKSYFRLLEHSMRGPQSNASDQNNETFDQLNNDLVAYDFETNRCEDELTSTWKLRGLTQILGDLFQLDESTLATKQTQLDRTSLGPTGLLRLVYQNADKFLLDSKAFDQLHLADSYYFSYKFKLDVMREAKLIVVMSLQHVDMQSHDGGQLDRIKVGKTMLTEVNSLGHIDAICLVTDQPNSTYLAKKSYELLDVWLNTPLQVALIVSYSLIQERSLSKHLGLVDSSDWTEPFLLPVGVGCGQASHHRPFYVGAKQFSGQFEAHGHQDEYSAAYDEASNHLRYDVLNKKKMIYSLDELIVTYVAGANQQKPAPATNKAPEPTMDHSNTNRVLENHHHCAQTSYMDEHGWLPQLFGAKTMSDTLGLGGDRVCLMYLGQTSKLDNNDDYEDDDGDNAEDDADALSYHVFEREVSPVQIPMLIRLHLLLSMTPTSRFTLVFYFIDEISSLTRRILFNEQFHAYESMWLKRVELVSILPSHKDTLLNSRLTFSKFSWSLESIAEETLDRQSKLLHPVRTFDTLECWPARGQTQLSFVLRQLAHQDDLVQQTNATTATTTTTTQATATNLQLVETLEETLMNFLTHQVDFPRAQVNDFELVVAVDERDGNEAGPPELPPTMLIRSKLTQPFEYSYKKFLVGWIKSVESILLAKQAKIIEFKYMMTYHECTLALAVELAGRLEFHMLYCPHVGCGYLTVKKLDGDSVAGAQPVDYVKVSEKNLYYSMCEIYSVNKRFSHLASERFLQDKFIPKLEHAQFTIESYALSQEREFATSLHRAEVLKVSLVNVLELDLWDEQILTGVCFSLASKLIGLANDTYAEELPMRVLVLDFDKHHSQAHCHKACMLYPHCETYSYSRQWRQCHLTSVSKALLQDPAVSIDEDQNSSSSSLTSSPLATDCTVHALSHVSLFKRRPYLVYNTPAILLQANYTLLAGASLDECANLCRKSELWVRGSSENSVQNSVPGCQSFVYMRLLSMCIFDPTTRVQLDEAASKQRVKDIGQLEEFSGDMILATGAEPCERHERDYLQYYSVRYNLGLEVQQQPDADHGQATTSSKSAVITMKDLTLLECARECTIIDSTCVMFDHCLGTISGGFTGLCHLYKIRSPLTIPGSYKLDSSSSSSSNNINSSIKKQSSDGLEAKLTTLEALFYIKDRSEEHHQVNVLPGEGCQHYFLEGDNLYLKRRLNVAPRKYQAEEEGLQRVANEMAKRIVPELDASASKGNISPSNTTGSVIAMITKMLAGIVLGFVVFFVQPKLGQAGADLGAMLGRIGASLQRLASRGTFGGRSMSRGERSMSQVGITEMVDIN